MDNYFHEVSLMQNNSFHSYPLFEVVKNWLIFFPFKRGALESVIRIQVIGYLVLKNIRALLTPIEESYTFEWWNRLLF